MTLKTCFALILAAVGLASTASRSSAQTTVTTDPVGFISTNCLSNSDTFLANPFTRPSEFVGTVTSVSGSTVVVSGTPGWTAATQFVYAAGTQPKTYYAIFGPSTSGTYAREGAIYTVVTNGSNSLTLAINGDNTAFSAIPATATITVIPYWTLATVFPASDATVSFTPTTSTFSMKTQVLIPNYSGTGKDMAPKMVYFYYSSLTSGTGWRTTGDYITDQGDTVLMPTGYIIVRNRSNAPTLPLTQSGAVYTKKLGLAVSSQITTKQDNYVTHGRPVDVPLSSLGFVPSLTSISGNFIATTTTFTMKDQIYLYDNTTTVLNKAPSKVYYYISSGSNVGWRDTGDPLADRSADTIPAASAIILRKAVTTDGASSFWINSPTF